MAIARRFTIGMLMAVVFLLAVDFGVVRALWETGPPGAGAAIVTLPMINVLLLAMPKSRESAPTAPFWMGFQAAGWIGVFVFGDMALYHWETFFSPLNTLDLILQGVLADLAVGMALMIAIAVILYTTPLLLFASLAGRLSAKYRIIIQRREAQ